MSDLDPKKFQGSNLPVRYEVGYGKPPTEHRFTKGRSGNPRGKPKGARNKPKIDTSFGSRAAEEMLDRVRLKLARLVYAPTHERRPSSGAWSERASRTVGPSFAIRSIPGSQPTVETVVFEGGHVWSDAFRAAAGQLLSSLAPRSSLPDDGGT